MNFKQYENGSCDIIFSENEIEILTKNGKLHLSDIDLRHLGNVLIRIVANWNIKFNEDVKKLNTFSDTEIKGK
jgi:hypothetical protein